MLAEVGAALDRRLPLALHAHVAAPDGRRHADRARTRLGVDVIGLSAAVEAVATQRVASERGTRRAGRVGGVPHRARASRCSRPTSTTRPSHRKPSSSSTRCRSPRAASSARSWCAASTAAATSTASSAGSRRSTARDRSSAPRSSTPRQGRRRGHERRRRTRSPPIALGYVRRGDRSGRDRRAPRPRGHRDRRGHPTAATPDPQTSVRRQKHAHTARY